MIAKKHLYVLWTSADPITADKMVFMYTINSMAHGWWDESYPGDLGRQYQTCQ